ncbi:hypothetical protein [Coleofasciculus sp. H7-2]|uniref:hypothetical protein n=1 Tax=Coleofasciculus sp. H7-2 TaxID=3351545 RepID=UPI003672F32F
MATVSPLRPNEITTPPKLLVRESKVTSQLQSPEGRKIAQVTENILLDLTAIQEFLESLENIREINYNLVPPKRSERVHMRAQFKGRGKPLPYPLDEE